MHLEMFDDCQMDSRRALWLSRARTLVLSDFFFGLGAGRRRTLEGLPLAAHLDPWERLVSLLSDYQPEQIVILGNIKPNQGNLVGEEALELNAYISKLTGKSRPVIQVVGQSDRSEGPAVTNPLFKVVEHLQIESYHFMHRRRIFVYPRLDNREIWINGGVHPVFALPVRSPSGGEDWMRVSGFLYTGYAVVMPPFMPYAQGHEVFLPDRLPKQAKGYKLLADRVSPIDLSQLPLPPEHLRHIARFTKKDRGGDSRTPIEPSL